MGESQILSLDAKGLAALRGNRIAYIAQSAASAFNPSRTIMDQVIEPALIHHLMPRAEAEKKAVELFRALALPFPDTIGSRYPHQLSGGQLQRLMAAMALVTDPELVILDEPTTALDVTTQIEVLRAFKAVVLERGATAIYVSHDLAVVAQMADQIVVLNQGRIREKGSADQVLHRPADDYTKTLMAAARPAIRPAPGQADAPAAPLLEIRGMTAGYGRIGKDGRPRIPVLRDINLTIERGATLGVIGESGSGKSTMARVIAGLLPPRRARCCSMASLCRQASRAVPATSSGASNWCSRMPTPRSIPRIASARSSPARSPSTMGSRAMPRACGCWSCSTSSACPRR